MFGKSLINLSVAALAAASVVSASSHSTYPFLPVWFLHVYLTLALPGRKHAALHKRVAEAPKVTTCYSTVTVWVDQRGNTVDPNAPHTLTVTVYGTRPPVTATEVVTKTRAVKSPKAETVIPPTSTAVYQPPAETTRSAVTTSPASSVYKPEPATLSKSPKPATTSKAPKPATTLVSVVSSSTSSKPIATGTPYVPGTYPAGGGSKPGIVYSPYHTDHSCKSTKEVAADIALLKDYSPIRLYGVDCSQIQNVIAAAKPHGIKIMPGVWNMDRPLEELETLIKYVDGNWDTVHTVAIGNEVVNFGRKSASDFAGIINASRKRLRRADVGYTGPVVGIDTFVAIMGNPAICEASDYVAANCHSFFDGNVAAEGTGEFLNNMKKEIAKVCGDKQIVITGKSTHSSPRCKPCDIRC